VRKVYRSCKEMIGLWELPRKRSVRIGLKPPRTRSVRLALEKGSRKGYD